MSVTVSRSANAPLVLLLKPSMEATPTREHWILRMLRLLRSRAALFPVYPAVMWCINWMVALLPVPKNLISAGQLRLQTSVLLPSILQEPLRMHKVMKQMIMCVFRKSGCESEYNRNYFYRKRIFSSLYPNPASNFVTVSYTAKQSGLVTMNLFTLNGQLGLQTTLSVCSQAHILETIRDLDALPAGVYMLQTIVDGSAKIRKAIIQ